MPRKKNRIGDPRRCLNKDQANWFADHPFSERVPDWLTPRDREVLEPQDSYEAALIRQHRAELDAHLNNGGDEHRSSYRRRREVEQQIARAVREWGFDDLADRLEHCRISGYWGENLSGNANPKQKKTIVLWDDKCGLSKLCPDEARIEQRRLVRRYLQPFLEWEKERGIRRLQKCVITWPNIKPGFLEEYLRAMPGEIVKLVKKFPVVKGFLQSFESPLSRHRDWNLHANLLLAIEGIFNWREFSAEWYAQTKHLFQGTTATHFQIEFDKEFSQMAHKTPEVLRERLIECIKYPVKHVMQKSEVPNVENERAANRGDQANVSVVGRDDQHKDIGYALHACDGIWRYTGMPHAERDARGRAEKYLFSVVGTAFFDDACRIVCGSLLCIVDGAFASTFRIIGFDNAGTTGERDGGNASKSERNPGRSGREEKAPPLIEWGKDLFTEWWSAHHKFRRTRSHGIFFSIAMFWWERSSEKRRRSWLEKAGIDSAVWSVPWKKLPLTKDERNTLRLIVDHDDDRKAPDIAVRGRVWFERGGGYAVDVGGYRRVVDSIQGDNSQSAATNKWRSNAGATAAARATGPPGADPPRASSNVAMNAREKCAS